MKKIVEIGLLAAVIFSISACRVIYIPIETGSSVNVKDSTVVHYIDSVRIHEATKYKDIAWLGDTLKIEGQRSKMWSYADTTKEALIGGLEEQEIKEKTKIIYKDKLKEVHDTTRIEIPIEIEKEVRITPKLYPWSLALNFLLLFLAGFGIYLKVKKK